MKTMKTKITTDAHYIIDLPRCETERQRRRDTLVWRHRRGHYILCSARRGGYYARFWPRLRRYQELLSRSGDVQCLGHFKTAIGALHRLQQHLTRTFRKPLVKGMWIDSITLRGHTKRQLKEWQKRGDYKPW
jgi:hypothetical protein